MAIQKQKYVMLEPFDAGPKGIGLRCMENIKAGQFVIEYVGEIISVQKVMQRLKVFAIARTRACSASLMHQAREFGQHYYALTIDPNHCIDAGRMGNAARFANHSCDPNTQTMKWYARCNCCVFTECRSVNGESRIGLFAVKDLQAGAELTFDYNFERFGCQPLTCTLTSNA
jgi:SET domain-containing protein